MFALPVYGMPIAAMRLAAVGAVASVLNPDVTKGTLYASPSEARTCGSDPATGGSVPLVMIGAAIISPDVDIFAAGRNRTPQPTIRYRWYMAPRDVVGNPNPVPANTSVELEVRYMNTWLPPETDPRGDHTHVAKFGKHNRSAWPLALAVTATRRVRVSGTVGMLTMSGTRAPSAALLNG